MVPPVPGHRGRELVFPEVPAGLGCRGVPAVLVAVPEAAVDEADCAVFWEDEIRFPGQVLPVKSVPETAGMKGLAQGELRLRILAPYSRHDARSRGHADRIGH